MAATEPGRQWLIKALHPSDELVTVDGVPDLTATPTVLLNYQSVCTINPPVAVVQQNTAWQADIAIIPDPLQPLAARAADMTQQNQVMFSFINPQLSTQTYPGAVTAWFGSGILKWRLAYMSVSLYQDGPALADQGTVVAAQVPVEYSLVSFTGIRDVSGQSSTLHTRVMVPGISGLNYSSVQAQPNAYFGQSKFGVYMPLHLDSLEEDGWRGVHDMNLWLANPQAIFYHNVPCGYICPSGGVPSSAYPYPTADQAHFWDPAAPNPLGDITCRPANSKWGFLSATNLSAQSRLTCYVRHGWEVMVTPTAQLASLQKVSPKFDGQALENYGRIVRELKDAYPVDFNDLGKLWDVLKIAAKAAVPFASMIPGVGSVVGPLVSGGSALLDILTTRRGRKTDLERAAPTQRQPNASAAQKEEIAEGLKAAAHAAVLQKAVKQKKKRRPNRGGAKAGSSGKPKGG